MIVIIGGGAIGLCTAYYLLREGAHVTIIDKGDAGEACSLHNAGYVSPSHFVPLASPGLFAQALKWMLNPRSPLYIKPRLDASLLSWAWHFRRACAPAVARRAMPVLRDLLVESADLFAALAREEGMDFEYTPRGLAILFNTEKGRRACEHECALAAEVNIDARMLDNARLHDLDPAIDFTARGGLFFPGDAHLVPAAFTASMRSFLLRRGVRFMERCEVLELVNGAAGISAVRTTEGLVEGDLIVLAAGSWSSAILAKTGIRMLLQPGKGYSLTVESPAVKPSLPYIFNERRVAITPFSRSLRFAGTMELAGLDLSINIPRVEAILDAVPAYFANVPRPGIGDGTIWAGLRPVTPDGMPYLGRFRRHPNLIAATGHAMLGISLAPVTGKRVAQIAYGIKPDGDLSLLDPNRFS